MSPTKSQEIIEIVRDAREPLDATTIHARSELSESRNQTANIICALVTQGRLERVEPKVQGEPKRYRLPGSKGAQTPLRRAAGKKAASKKKAEVKSAKGDGGREAAAAPAATEQPDPARKVLEDNARRSQDALDEYLASVCDPGVMSELRDARDHARRALDRYTGRAER